jgi:hypothetical protein
MSKEHFWSQWMKEFLSSGTDLSYVHDIYTSEAEKPSTKTFHATRQGDVITKKIRVVCRKCNSGWMGSLEEKVKHILVKLIENSVTSLLAIEQKLLSEWITMKALVAEHSEGGTQITPIQDRKAFYLHRLIPSYFSIYIGVNNTSSMSGFVRNSIALSPTKSLEKNIKELNLKGLVKNTQSISFICGKLFIYILASRVDGINIRDRFDLSPMVRVWPKEKDRIEWPISPTLSERVLSDITHSLNRLASKAKYAGPLKKQD